MFIPVFKENGAAITTMIAEGIVFIYCRFSSKGSIAYNGILNTLVKTVIGTIPMPIIAYVIKMYIHNEIIVLCIVVVLCVLEFICIEIALKNEIIIKYLEEIKEKIGG